MKRLTAKEEEIMGYFWEKGPLFVKQLLEYYEEPKPHFNTLSCEVWKIKVFLHTILSVTHINIMPLSPKRLIVVAL